jgi:hypothetical protein
MMDPFNSIYKLDGKRYNADTAGSGSQTFHYQELQIEKK